MKDDRVYLLHILECIDALRDYVKEGKEAFFTDRKTRKATIREESCRNSPSLHKGFRTP